MRIFPRCLLILLDSLDVAGPGDCVLTRDSLSAGQGSTSASTSNTQEETLHQIASTWLSTALLTGQAGRAIAPLFAALLHPSTARTSLVAMRERARLVRKIARQKAKTAGKGV